MNRREVIALVGGIAAWPSPAKAQSSKIPRVAFVGAVPPVSRLRVGPLPGAFVGGLRALGYVDGKNVILEWRSAEGRYERYPEIFKELVSIPVDVIVTVNSLGVKIAQEVTQTIPIVMIGITDPVTQGLIQSLARPGGNVTGTTDDTGAENAQKRLQLLKELLPAMTTVACLVAPGPFRRAEGNILQAAAASLGIKLLFAEHPPADYTDAFALITRERPDALFVSQIGENFPHRHLIVEFAANNRLPTIYPFREFVEAGGLMAYGMDVADLFRLAAWHVERILRGEKPGDLPVQQPTKFLLAINLKAAKVLGITVPPSLLARADEVIE